MSDPAIKLFGKTIQLPESETLTNGEVVMQVSEFDDQPSSSSWSSEADSKGNKRERESDANNNKCEEKSINKEENRTNSTKTPSADNESATTKASKSEEQQSEQEKTLKKPDKILPCPRCNSMDTKFCYYNNYNVNQPRHFCKNCQRYWTAGGTMRNVPVGAGRRKNKTSSSQLRQLSISETLPSDLKLKQTVLTFGSNAPLCESMASVLKTADKSLNKPEELPINDDNTNNGFSTHVPCFPGAPWPNPYPYPYPWSPQMGPTFCPPPGYPMSFYPAAPYWGCAIPAPGPPWNMQWVPAPPNYHPAPAPPGTSKNGEEETETTKEEEPEKSLWAPKTLRIDDPDEAAKSSIWATLGIKNEGAVGGNGGGGMFKAFRSKGEDKEAIKEASPALQANPAALSRSLNFQERS